MKPLTYPLPLDQRLFHSREVVDQYNADVAAYLAAQQQIAYSHSRSSKHKHKSRRQQYDEQPN